MALAASPTAQKGPPRSGRPAATEAGMSANAMAAAMDLAARQGRPTSAIEDRGYATKPETCVALGRDAALGRSRAPRHTSGASSGAIAGPTRLSAVPLLDVVDTPAATAGRASDAKTTRTPAAVVRVVGDAITLTFGIAASGLTATHAIPSTDARRQADTAALTALGGPMVPIPRPAISIKVAPIPPRAYARPSGALGPLVLFGRRRP